MGVPRLFPYIVRHFPNAQKIIRKIRTEFYEIKNKYAKTASNNIPFILNVDNLFLDSNPFLHSAAQKIFVYGECKRMIKTSYDSKPYSIKLELVFKLFFESILEILKYIKPNKVLFIALDGSAPWAKITQQRERRFKSAMTKPPSFDPNSITPGTELMSDLTRYINFRIRKEMNSDFNNSVFPPSVIFSSCTVPGEGEHKLINYMRRNFHQVQNESNCIYGPDADLIMLALSTHLRNFFVVKPDTVDRDIRHILDFNYITKDLPRKLNRSYESMLQTNDDFVLLGFFVGNDFLPKMQMFLYLENGLNLLIETYRNQDFHLTYFDEHRGRHMINIYKLCELLYFIKNHEEEKLLASLKADLSEMFTNHTLKKHVHDDKLDFEGYRKDYYLKAEVHNEREIQEMCINYIQGLFWVLQYYLDGNQSWSFCYEYHYPPLIMDLVVELNRIGMRDCGQYNFELDTYKLDEPLCPFEQLLSVLPATSSTLLPKELRHIQTDSELSNMGYYKGITDQDIDYEGKTDEFMGIVLLPFIERENIQKEYEKYKNKIKYHRNVLGRDVVFVRDENTKVKYKSKYGTISNLHVRKQNL
jgi:5'-3' exonuclease